MQTSEIRELAQKRMELFKIGHWKLTFSHSKSYIGRCRRSVYHKNPQYSHGELFLSLDFMEILPREEIIDTINHEIAHALTPPGVKDHGPEWRDMAVRCGARPRASAPAGLPGPKKRYDGRCTQGHEYSRDKGLAGMQSGGYYCPPCRRNKVYDVIIWTDTQSGRVVNPAFAKQGNSVTLATAAKTPTRKVVKAPASTSFKDRYDRGDTSFADVW